MKILFCSGTSAAPVFSFGSGHRRIILAGKNRGYARIYGGPSIKNEDIHRPALFVTWRLK